MLKYSSCDAKQQTIRCIYAVGCGNQNVSVVLSTVIYSSPPFIQPPFTMKKWVCKSGLLLYLANLKLYCWSIQQVQQGSN